MAGKSRRTVLYSSKGKKLYAVRDKSGQFKDIQQYSRAHAMDIKRKSKAEVASDKKKAAKKPAKKRPAAKKAAKRPAAKKTAARKVAAKRPAAKRKAAKKSVGKSLKSMVGKAAVKAKKAGAAVKRAVKRTVRKVTKK
jgi:hypothetical protein